MDKIIRIINYTDYINHEYVFGGKYINYKYTLLKRKKNVCSEMVFALSESMVIVNIWLFLLPLF